LIIRHKKYSAASVKSVKKNYYNTKSKIKRYEQMLMLSSRSLQKKQGFFDDQYSVSSEKYTQKNFNKNNIKFFKNFNDVITSVCFKKNLKINSIKKQPININSGNLIKFWKKITIFNKILNRKYKKIISNHKFPNFNRSNRSISIFKTNKMYKFLNLFLINSGKNIDIKKLLVKNKKKLGELSSKKLFFLLKNK
jgi:hypothetical protein